MSHYDDNPDDLVHDTKDFLASDYGQYLTALLKDMEDGTLSSISTPHISGLEHFAGKYTAIKEITNLIYSPLGDDTPSHG